MVHGNRRRFLKSSMALAGSTFAISGTKSSGNILGANERVRVAVAGLHGRGKSHMGEFSKMKDVEITYLVDPDTRQFAPSVKRVSDVAGNSPKTVQDVREALDDPNLDAISVATPNHWHSLITVWACQAGKDVYVEKPCSHNVHEGRVAVEAARKFGRIVQHGTQSRSDRSWNNIIDVVKSGHYGPLKVSHAIVYKRRMSIGFQDHKSAPSELDFNLWLGPAPMQPYHENLVHYNWHWFWDTGNGDIGNQGVHQMDIARWGIDGATLPKSVVSLGGRFGYTDQGETANTQLTVFDFGAAKLLFEVRGLVPKNYITNQFHFAEGTIREDQKFYRNGSDVGEPIPDTDDGRGPGEGNFGNFIAAVKSRKVDDLNADILEGHFSSALCHLANISYRRGTELPFSSRKGVFAGDNPAGDAFGSMEEHLAKDNELALDDMTYQLGKKLMVDSSSESFSNDDQANQLLTRNYRKPFVVPERIA